MERHYLASIAQMATDNVTRLLNNTHTLNTAYTSWDWNTAACDQLVRHSRRSGDLLTMGLRCFLVASQPPRVVSVTKHWSTLDPGLAGKHEMFHHVFQMQIQRRVDDSGVLF